jgi:hypothetical protein
MFKMTTYPPDTRKYMKTLIIKSSPVWWASHDAPKHRTPGAMEHNKFVRSHRSGIEAKHWKSDITAANLSNEMLRFSQCRFAPIHGVLWFVQPCCCHLLTKRTNMHGPKKKQWITLTKIWIEFNNVDNKHNHSSANEINTLYSCIGSDRICLPFLIVIA